MIDFILIAGFLISTALFIHIEKIAPSINASKSMALKKMRWLPLMIISVKQLRQSGVFINSAIFSVYALKVSVAVTVFLIFYVLPYNVSFRYLATISAISFFAPDIWYHIKRKSRQNTITSSLEFYLRVLMVYMKAGFNFERAFLLALKHGLSQSHPLAIELQLFSYELDAGQSRDEAFRALYYRTGVKGVKSLADLMAIGVMLGTPLTQAVEAQLQTVSLERNIAMEKKVNRKTLHTTFPLILISFPMFLVLVFFPAALQVMNVLQLLVSGL